MMKKAALVLMAKCRSNSSSVTSVIECPTAMPVVFTQAYSDPQ